MILTTLTKIARSDVDQATKNVFMRFTVQFYGWNFKNEEHYAGLFDDAVAELNNHGGLEVFCDTEHVTKYPLTINGGDKAGLRNVQVDNIVDFSHRAAVAFILGFFCYRSTHAPMVMDANDNWNGEYNLGVRLELNNNDPVDLLWAYNSAHEHNFWHRSKPYVTGLAYKKVALVSYDVLSNHLDKFAQWGQQLAIRTSVDNYSLSWRG